MDPMTKPKPAKKMRTAIPAVLSVLLAGVVLIFGSCGPKVKPVGPDSGTSSAESGTVTPGPGTNEPGTVTDEPGPLYADGELAYISNRDGTCSVSGIGGFRGSELVIPAVSTAGDRVTAVRRMAFYGCTDLTSVTVPEGVVSIGNDAFSGCASLATVTLPESLISIGDSVFYRCSALSELTIPAGVTSIGSSAFADCAALTSVVLPDGIESLGEAAFAGCRALELNRIGNADYIGSEAEPYLLLIRAATATIDVCDIPEGTRFIDTGAFSGCADLTALSLPASVEVIGTGAFSGCAGLETIAVAQGNPRYVGVENCLIDKTSGVLVRGCRNSVIPDDGSVTVLGENAFSGCADLTELTIPACITEIHSSAFRDCVSLTALTLPAGLTGLGAGVFEGCVALTEMVIPNGVTHLPGFTFRNCSSLVRVTLPASITVIGDEVFRSCRKLDVIFYEGNREQWNAIEKGGNWSGTDIWSSHSTIIMFREPYSVGLSFFSGGNGTCAVSGIGTCTDTDVVVPPLSPDGEPVTDVWHGAFADSKITSIELPDGITRIQDGAFQNCADLVCVVFPETLVAIDEGAFIGCDSLEELDLPASLTKIDPYAFRLCPNLKTIRIADENPRYRMTSGCLIDKETKTLVLALPEFTVPDDGSVTGIGLVAFYGGTMQQGNFLPESVDRLEMGAFAECVNLKSMHIPDGVTALPDSLFHHCASMTMVSLPGTITQIGSGVFDSCDALMYVYFDGTRAQWDAIWKHRDWTAGWINADSFLVVCLRDSEVTTEELRYRSAGDGTCEVARVETGTDKRIVIPPVSPDGDRVTGIAYSAFSYCESLTSVILPPGITKIGDRAFEGCSALSRVVSPSGVTEIGDSAFSGCKSLEELPDMSGVTLIGRRTFEGCSSLKTVVLPEGLTEIGMYAFSYCTGLRSVVFPEGLKKIRDYAFQYCKSLTQVTLPESLFYIGRDIFKNCPGLMEICNQSSIPDMKLSNFTWRIYRTRESYLVAAGDFLFYDDGKNVFLVQYIGDSDTLPDLPDSYDGKSYRIYSTDALFPQ